MATLLDAKGQPLQVPDEGYHDAIDTGTGFLPAGATVGVTTPEGAYKEIPSEQVYNEIDNGSRVMDPTSYAQAKYSGPGQILKTVAEGMFSGASAGLSEAAEKGFGIATPEAISGRKAANPVLHGAAEVAGATLPALFGDELSPAALIARGGEAAADVAGGGLAGDVLSGVFQGGAYAGSQEASQQAFSGKPADIDKVLAAAGGGSLFGGATSGLFGMIGAVGRKVAGFGGPGSVPPGVPTDAIGALTDSLEAKAEADPTTLGGKILSLFIGKEKAAAFSRLTGGGAPYRDLANLPSGDFEKMVIAGSKAIGETQDALEDNIRKVSGLIKPAEINAGLAAADPVLARNEGFARFEATNAEIATMRAEPENFFDSSKIAQLEKQNMAFGKVLGVEPIGVLGIDPVTGLPIPKWGLGAGSTPTAADIFHEADRMRGALGTIGKLGMAVPETEQPAAGVVNRIRKEVLRPFLEDQGVFGSAAAAQSHYNSLISDTIEAGDRFNEYFGRGAGYKGGSQKFEVNPGKLKSLFQNVGQASNELPKAAFLNWLGSARSVADEMGAANGDLGKRIAAMLPGTSDLAKISAAKADLAKIAQRTGEASGLLGVAMERGAIGHFMGGAPGAVAGASSAIFGSLSSVPAAMHILDRVVQGQNARIGTLAEAIATGLKRGLGRAPIGATAILDQISFSDRTYPAPAKDSSEAFNRRVAELQAFTAHPEQLQAAVTRNLGPLLQAHPAVGQAIAAQTIRKTAILASQVPQGAPQTPLWATAAKEPPGEIDRGNFADAVAVFSNPLTPLEEMARGRLTPAMAANSKAMNPELHAEMTQAVIKAVEGSGRVMPYAQRLQFSIFAGMDLDPSLSQASMMASQAPYAPPAEPQNSEPPKLESSKTSKSVKGAHDAAEVASGSQQLEMDNA